MIIKHQLGRCIVEQTMFETKEPFGS
uniref:Uncharacterized protein n=1 Tax=Arundo donax TaxID=35708 RepID=A0A0A9FHZ4_ARUDO